MVLVSFAKFAASAAGKAAKSATGKGATPKVPKSQSSSFTKPIPVSPALKKFVGSGEISRPETIKKIWAYIKEHNLQDPMAKKEIVCDDTLKQLFPDKERISFSEISRLLQPHFLKKGQS